MNRRISRIVALLIAFGLNPDSRQSGYAFTNMPITGKRVQSMAAFDSEFCELLSRWQIPGAAIAVVQNGKLVFSRGYGLADTKSQRPVEPNSVFRIGSISKIFTAVATLKLVEQGRLSLDTRAFPILKLPQIKDPHYRGNPDLNKITIRHLLECSCGWDRNNGGDPMFMPVAKYAAEEFSNSLRPTPRAIIRYQSRQNFDFVPGTHFSYSNIAYSILGEVIKKVSGQSYASYVRDQLLVPLGLKHTYPGRTIEAAEGEVSYHGYPGEISSESIIPNLKGTVPQEYGGNFYLEGLTADSGWVASVTDVALFVSSVLGERGKSNQILSPDMTKLMLSRPPMRYWKDTEDYFAFGWEVERAETKDQIIQKEGCLPGSTSIVRHQHNTTVAIAFNSRPLMTEQFQGETKELIERSLTSNTNWK